MGLDASVREAIWNRSRPVKYFDMLPGRVRVFGVKGFRRRALGLMGFP